MNITIQSLHFTANQTLKDFVNEKMGKLEHVNNQITSGDVVLKLDKSDTDENKICEISLKAPGKDLFAKNQCATFEEAVNETVEALQKQLRKLKTQKLSKRRVAE
ncbi:MAG TPA: ribosome-associated translation inhibitor RaiA [Bacteroidia bacterium]|jgi:putative sigma-54 modulation protein|nr:ribosome-associated translation inhibitor RaiA [Bacteroidia bacterium]